MSRYSPCVVANDERLARFVFSPMHVSKSGRFKGSVFSHVENRGCSIQRDTRATDEELAAFVTEFLERNPKQVWKGVILGSCADVRAISMAQRPEDRAVCVYDSAEPEYPAHAEMCRSHVAVDEADSNEIRVLLTEAFGSGTIIAPAEYRGGAVWKKLAPELRDRGERAA